MGVHVCIRKFKMAFLTNALSNIGLPVAADRCIPGLFQGLSNSFTTTHYRCSGPVVISLSQDSAYCLSTRLVFRFAPDGRPPQTLLRRT